MASPSSIDSPLHLDLDPLMQRLVALIKANDSLACIQCNVVLYFWSHLVASLSANRLKKASLSANRLIFICLYDIIFICFGFGPCISCKCYCCIPHQQNCYQKKKIKFISKRNLTQNLYRTMKHEIKVQHSQSDRMRHHSLPYQFN